MSGKVWVKTDVSGDGSIKFKKEKWKVEITCKESLSQNLHLRNDGKHSELFLQDPK